MGHDMNPHNIDVCSLVVSISTHSQLLTSKHKSSMKVCSNCLRLIKVSISANSYSSQNLIPRKSLGKIHHFCDRGSDLE